MKRLCRQGHGEWSRCFRKFSRKVDGNSRKGDGTAVMDDKKNLVKRTLNNFEVYLTMKVNGGEDRKNMFNVYKQTNNFGVFY